MAQSNFLRQLLPYIALFFIGAVGTMGLVSLIDPASLDTLNTGGGGAAVVVRATGTPTPEPIGTTGAGLAGVGLVSLPPSATRDPNISDLAYQSMLTATALCIVTVPPGQGVMYYALFGTPTAPVYATPTPDYVASAEPGNIERGREVFAGEGQCTSCHNIDNDEWFVGPSLRLVALRAPYMRPDLTAEQYLYGAILDPGLYIVSKEKPGVMPVSYRGVLTPQQVADVVAYLLTMQ